MGDTKDHFVEFSLAGNLNQKRGLDTLNHVHNIQVSQTPVKYERDIIQITSDFIILKNWENNRTEKIGLVTSTPAGAKVPIVILSWTHVAMWQCFYYFLLRITIVIVTIC